MQRDPYEVLGVARDADETQIKKAFRALARELHPDVNSHDPDAEEKFKEAAEAYEILNDPERRAIFDRYGHEGLRSGGWDPGFERFGSVSDLFEAFFGGGTGGIFGGGMGGGPAPGGDVGAALELDLADAASGGPHEVEFDVVELCERCHGNGAEPGTPVVGCERCGGAGRRQTVTRTPFGQMVRTVPCDTCNGDGRVATEPCQECSGRGRKLARRTLRVDVPPGISDGQRIRIAGRGHVGDPGAPPGDAYVLVSVRQDERFVRDGDDLVTVVDVAAPAAALGTRVDVPTLDAAEHLELPAGTQPGDVLVLRGRGMPRLQRSGAGDLRVIVNVLIPRNLDRKQRDMLEQFADTITEQNLKSNESMLAKLRRALRSSAA
jgi:molecular chaperone DnaJ